MSGSEGDGSRKREREDESNGQQVATSTDPAAMKAAHVAANKAAKERRIQGKKLIGAVTKAMTDEEDPRVAGAALVEAIKAKLITIQASLVAGVLHKYYAAGEFQAGVEFFRTHLANQYEDCDNEKICVLAVRLECRAPSSGSSSSPSLKDRVTDVAGRLHAKGVLKRRLFTEPLKQLSSEGNIDGCLSLYDVASNYNVELWEEDLLAVAEGILRMPPAEDEEKVSKITELIHSTMGRYHPVVGRRLAGTIAAILANKSSSGEVDGILASSMPVGTNGICSKCKSKLHSFDFAPADRQALLQDIRNRLVGPSLKRFKATGSHRVKKGGPVFEYSANDPPLTEEELSPFTRFSDDMRSVCGAPLPPEYDAYCILDGANIGYFRVSAWYSEAKKDVFQSQGIDPATKPASEFDHSVRKGQAMDVPLNFDAIDEAIKKAIQRRWYPVVVLHERHLQTSTMTKRNQQYLEKWEAVAAERGRKVVVSSPAAVNDDFAWLHASVEFKTFVMSNDLMRDHHYHTLGQRGFLRWRERHRATFSIYWPNPTESLNNSKFSIFNPPEYSTWIQQFDSNPRHWHIPFYEKIDVVDQSTNVVKTAEEIEKEEAEAESIRWICTCVPLLT